MWFSSPPSRSSQSVPGALQSRSPRHPITLGPFSSPVPRLLVYLCPSSSQFRASQFSSFSLRTAHRQSSLGPGFLEYSFIIPWGLLDRLARNQPYTSPAQSTAATQPPRAHAPPLTSETAADSSTSGPEWSAPAQIATARACPSEQRSQYGVGGGPIHAAPAYNALMPLFEPLLGRFGAL